jgi:hypothetical protein
MIEWGFPSKCPNDPIFVHHNSIAIKFGQSNCWPHPTLPPTTFAKLPKILEK